MSRKKKGSKKEQKSYGEKIAACVGKSWKSTGDIIKAVKCPPRAARRVLRGLVKQRVLKSVKVQRERYFAKPGTQSAPPKAEAGNGRTRSRSRKAKSASKRSAKGSGGKKSKRRRAGKERHVQSQKNSRRERKPSGAQRASGKNATRARRRSGQSGTPASAPDSVADLKKVAERTVDLSLLS